MWSPNSDGYGFHFDVCRGGGVCISGLHTYQGTEVRNRNLDRAINSAREKFTGKMQEQALLAVNFYERQQSMTMMAKRLDFLEKTTREVFRLATSRSWQRGELLNLRNSLQRALNDVRKFKTKESSRKVADLMIQKIKDWRGSGQSLGNLWLELHFGWEPLLKDINACMEIFGETPKPKFYKCKGITLESQELIRSTYGIIGGVWHGWTWEPKTRVHATCFGLVEISDPNLYRTQKLGLMNPALFAWEIIPFSFVIDWFANISQWLSQFDEFMGINLKSVGYSVRASQTSKGSWTERSGSTTAVSSMNYYQRFDSLPSVKLGWRPAKAISPIRALTSISLLLTRLKNPAVQKQQPVRS